MSTEEILKQTKRAIEDIATQNGHIITWKENSVGAWNGRCTNKACQATGLISTSASGHLPGTALLGKTCPVILEWIK